MTAAPDLPLIRLARPADGPACAAIYAPFVTDGWVSMELVPPDDAEMSARIARTLATYPWLVAEAAQTVLGYAYASRHRERPGYRWAVDVTVYLAPDARGRGLGQALYAALLDVLRRQGFLRAYAGIALPNDASIRLHETMGFRPFATYRRVGFKLGGWRDVGYWEFSLGEADPPPEPTTLPDLGAVRLVQPTGASVRKSIAKPPSK
jgi:L-amino acid N-acyltransferase YncA